MSVGSAQQMSRLQGKKAIRSFARKLAEPETIRELNITPMMDMMTIILVFLLKSFTSSTNLIVQDQSLSLAPSMTRLQAKQDQLKLQFSNLETALSSLKNQSSWLAGQISSLG